MSEIRPGATEDGFESLVTRVLREQPPLRAPVSLERRVLAEIEHRTRLPWWRASFMSWPRVAQAAFLVTSLAVARLALLAMTRALELIEAARPGETIGPLTRHAAEAARALEATGDAIALAIHSIPSVWLYAGLAVAAGLYAALFGLGAAAYRILFQRR